MEKKTCFVKEDSIQLFKSNLVDPENKEETEDSELISELEDRGYYVSKIITTGYESMISLPKHKLRECLQDSFELNHHVSDEVLLETIKNALK
ncbi:hypothetical protein [Dysgonomonas capnocytophagoides]|uniref:hypothetical protein n=1 Tax=Dysgonomonas capnocytophagoides TaxID=45254 RepID=UPI00291E0A69|nr:hypothetical protein DCPSUM001_32990 [Dysgonomonas capnocytophagoides]